MRAPPRQPGCSKASLMRPLSCLDSAGLQGAEGSLLRPR